jgi:uncharacterized protein (TIGR03437 family)
MTKVALYLASAVVVYAQSGVVTYHNDTERTGQYLVEPLLTPANVKPGLFGNRFTLPVDGAVYGQPLYLPRVNIVGKGLRDVLFVVTSHDSVYAFDADDESAAGAQPLWQVSFLDSSTDVTTVSAADVNCPVIPELGIAGTPVIDPVAGTIYVVAETKESGTNYVFRLHALDVTTGAERAGSPVVIQPSGFVPLLHKQRTALLLANGIVYSAWSGHCDAGAYHGWILAHDATTLGMVGSFNTTPNDQGASFWSGGAGPAADTDGNVYAVSANGDFDGNIAAARYDESVLRFPPGSALSVADMFTPFNKSALDAGDLDIGSSGAILLPDDVGSAAHPHLLFTSGKEGRLYLLDRDSLGGAQTGSDTAALASLPVLNQATFGSSAYFNGNIYVGAKLSPLLAFPVANATLGSSPSAQSASSFGTLGSVPSISANGNQNGIAWAISGAGSGSLIAYDAATLSQLFSDNLAGYLEFVVPTIADSKVFASGGNSIAIYGELPQATPVINSTVNAASFASNALSPGSLFSIFGSGLAPLTASAPSMPLPLTLADVSVTVNGLEAPLLYVSAQQINAQMPSAVPTGQVSVVVRVSGKLSTAATVTIKQTAPGIFTGADDQAAALNSDGSENAADNPAAAGSLVSVFFTGPGPVETLPVDGEAAPSAAPDSVASPVTATIGGMPAQIQFAGLAPGWVGLGQINMKVPDLGSGTFPVAITIGTSVSNPGNLSVQ